MFWGNGDSAKLAEEERQTLAHLRRMTETGHIVALSPKDVEVALTALEWYRRWSGSFQLLNSIKNVGLLVAAVLGLWWATQGAVADWIRSLGG